VTGSLAAAFPTDMADDDGMPAAEYRSFCRLLAAGVSVLTSRNAAGPVGLTATAVTSLSMRPPLLLACLAAQSRTLAAIRTQRAFAVHLLRAEQQDCAQVFASRSTADEKFRHVRWSHVLGVPVLRDVLHWLVCFVEDERRYGDHSIVVGRVVAGRGATGAPLLWHDRSYWDLAPPAGPEPSGLEPSGLEPSGLESRSASITSIAERRPDSTAPSR
jgi:flavin reductase (DIM6/NTAB) family NADH-FMN oxidoreductase RutF